LTDAKQFEKARSLLISSAWMGLTYIAGPHFYDPSIIIKAYAKLTVK